MTKIDLEKLKQQILESLIPTLTETISEIVKSNVNPQINIDIQEPKKKRGRPKKVKESEKLQPPTKSVNTNKIIFVREDISKPSTYVDDLTEEVELIETDKLVCKSSGKKIIRDQDSMIKTRKCSRSLDDNTVCGREFEAYGAEYLCPKCAEKVRYAAKGNE